jgi:dienelactone hydrolase
MSMMTSGAGTDGTHASGSGGMQALGSGGMQASGSGGMQAAGSGGSTSMADAGAAKDGGAMPGPGGFPRGDDVNTDRMGPYEFDSYTDGLDDPEYSSSVLYYPTNAPPPFAVVAFAPGYTATKDDYKDFLGPLLASHGIVILLTTPTNTDADQPPARGDDLEAALKHLVAENEREGSPVKGKLAADRACITGQSMGGGGTLWAATDLGDMIRCAVPLQPWQPGQSFDKIVAPTMFIAAQNDTVAGVAQNAKYFYDSMPGSTIKYYVEFAGADHFLTTNDLGTAYDVQSKYMIAFYKVYLEDDMRYLDVLNASADAALSMYLKPM